MNNSVLRLREYPALRWLADSPAIDKRNERRDVDVVILISSSRDPHRHKHVAFVDAERDLVAQFDLNSATNFASPLHKSLSIAPTTACILSGVRIQLVEIWMETSFWVARPR